MRKKLLILWFLFVVVVVGFAKVSLRSFCKRYEITPVYHLAEHWLSLNKGGKRIKLFLEVPYIVDDAYFYRTDLLPETDTNGDLIISDDTARRIADLIRSFSSVSASATSTNLPNIISKSSVDSSKRIIEEHFVSVSSARSSSYDKNFGKSSSKSSSEVSSFRTASRGKKVSYSSGKAQVHGRADFVPINAVVIDPGHGGKDPGGLGVHGEKEKEIVLSVAKRVYAKFKKDKGIVAVLTRHKDVFVTLEGRTLKTSKLMERYNPIFVSIHANISFNHKVSGIEIYYFGNPQSDENERYLENLENRGFDKQDIKKTQALFVILSELIRDGVIAESGVLGRYLMKNMVRQTKAKNRKVRQAHFYVLKYNPVASVLLEIGFLSNKREVKQLMTSSYREKMAEGIYRGIKEFIIDYNRKKGVIK